MPGNPDLSQSQSILKKFLKILHFLDRVLNFASGRKKSQKSAAFYENI